MILDIGKHKVLELWGPKFWKFRQITLTDLHCTFRWKGDHAPEFVFNLCILNLELIQIHFYDTRHEDDQEETTAS